jgi:hypothetical protein
MASNSRIIDIQNDASITITVSPDNEPDNESDDESDDEVEEMCCVECFKTIPTGDKIFTCRYNVVALEYCSDCFNLDATCMDSACADCAAFREVHAITCDNCGYELDEDENMGACMCGDKTRICQTCGDWCKKQNAWCCGKELCVVFPDEDESEDEDEDDDVNCAVCRTEILGNAFFCEGAQALMCSDCFDEHPKCSRAQRAKKCCDDCSRTMEADESDYDSDEYEAVVEQRKKMCLRVGEALMAEMDSSMAIMPAKPLMEDDEFNCSGCGKEDVPMDTMFLCDYVLNDDGTFEDGGRVLCSCCADEFRQAQHRRQRDSSLVVTDNAPNHETEELD